MNPRPQDAQRRFGRRGGLVGLGIAVHEGEQRRVGQSELDVEVPSGPKLGDGVTERFRPKTRLRGEVRGIAVLGDLGEQARLVPEQPVIVGACVPAAAATDLVDTPSRPCAARSCVATSTMRSRISLRPTSGRAASASSVTLTTLAEPC